MFEHLRRFVLRLARVPEAPHPPAGAPASVRVFRAGRNHYYLRLMSWGLAQVATFSGILFSLAFLHELKLSLEEQQSPGRLEQSAPRLLDRWEAPRELAEKVPAWVLPLVVAAEALGIAAFVLQLPLTWAAVRLDWEMRWYIVTDRSLRIRAGIWKLQESTMSFANLQQVEVRQGPLQRVLGLADVQVRSAGGGGGGEQAGHQSGESMHQGVFHGVPNAVEIRDLILERLRRYRAAGLGDPDDHRDDESGPAAGGPGAALTAARELLDEARALRQALQEHSRA